jgi:site-specific recombinase XerD
MIEDLFKRPTILARYRAGPLAAARDEFLEHCAKEGYSRSMLRKIAWVLLAVAHNVDTDHGNMSTQDIERAVDSRVRFSRRPLRTKESLWTRQMFIHFATEWLRRLGCLQEAPGAQNAFAAQIDAFASHMRDERGLSPVTISTRCERLAWFFGGLCPPRETLAAITVADVDAFIESKGKQGWTRASLAALASSLRSFFSFAEARGWCAPGITAVIESPRLYAREGIPEGPGWDDVQRLFASTSGDRPADIRDHAILMLLAVYGLRRGEVAGLRLDDLDWEGELIHIARPKQRRAQRYPLLPAVGEAILRYLREVRPRCGDRTLFLTLGAPIRPLSAPSITPVAHAHLSRLGLTLSPRGAHCLRHACASHLLASGFSLKQIGDHLGHRSANSTLSYTKVDLIGLRQVAELDLGELL